MSGIQSAGYFIPNFTPVAVQENSEDEVNFTKAGLANSGPSINETVSRASLSMSDIALSPDYSKDGSRLTGANVSSGQLERPMLRGSNAENEVLLDDLLKVIDEILEPKNKKILYTIKGFSEKALQNVISVIVKTVENIPDAELKSQVKYALGDSEDLRKIGELTLAMVGSARGNASTAVDVIHDDAAVVEAEGKADSKGPVYAGFKTNDVVFALMKILREVLQSLDINERKMNANLSMLSAQMTQSAAQETIRQGVVQRNAAIAGFVVSGVVAGMGATVSAHGLHKQNKAIAQLKASNVEGAKAQGIKLDLAQDAGKTNKSISFTDSDGVQTHLAPEVKSHHESVGAAHGLERHKEAKASAKLHAQNYDQITNNARFQTQTGDNVLHMNNTVGQVAQSGVAEEASVAGAANQVASDAAQAARSAAQDKDKQIEKSHTEFDQIYQKFVDLVNSKQRTTASVLRG